MIRPAVSRLRTENLWLLDGILRNDPFAKEGRAAFPGIPYLAPEGFSEVARFATTLRAALDAARFSIA